MIIIKFFTCFSNLVQSNVVHVNVNNCITTCKSYVNVKHLYLHVDKRFTLTLILLSFIYIYIYIYNFILHLLKAYVNIHQIQLHGLV
jgi:hypothetical protein